MNKSLRFLLAVPVAAALLAGCGKTMTTQTVTRTVTASKTQPQFVCRHKVPAQLGECVRQELQAKGIKLGALAPRVSAGSNCVDISIWQGVPNFREAGVKCAIVQTNDGSHSNSLFYAQARELRNHGIPFGIYTFLEAYSGESQAATAVSIARGQGATLGAWADAEISGSYEHACAYVNYAHSHGFPIVGVYSSPGNWPGYRCQGWIWPALWGGGRAYPLSGYPYSAIKLRQFCGVCRLPGFGGEVDRDEDLGLLTLAHPTPPKPPSRARLKAELYGHYHFRALLRGLLTTHQCRTGHAKPARYSHACRVWLAQGAATNQAIRKLHARGIY